MQETEERRLAVAQLLAAYDPELDGPAAFAELQAAVNGLLDIWRPRP